MLRTASRDSDEGGFILMEAVVAIGIVIVVLAGLTTFFLTVHDASGELRAKQAATVLAGNALDRVRAMPPSDTYAGHTATAVQAQLDAAPAALSTWLASQEMYPAYDDSGGTSKLDLTKVSSPINGVAYTTNIYVGLCAVPVDSSKGTECMTECPAASHRALGSCTAGYATTIATASYLRYVVAVSWRDASCAQKLCTFVTATLISRKEVNPDPNFLLNQSPPNPPVINAIPDQTNAINDQVSLQLSLLANTGVNPNTWTISNLPNGLSIGVDTGLISGTVAGPTGTKTVSVTVTDAFNRTDTKTFKWTVLPDLVPSDPGAQTTMVGATVSVTMSATGGTGTGYTWTAPGSGTGALPDGVTISSDGKITGKPTKEGTFNSTVTVADSSGRTRTRDIKWTVKPAPTTTGLASENVTPGTAKTTAISYTCATSDCTYSVTGDPANYGLSKNTSGSVADSVTVNDSSGTIYLRGKDSDKNLPFGTTAWNVVITPKDNTFNVTGTPDTEVWKATWIDGLTDISGKKGTTFATQNLAYSCATTTCTLGLSVKYNGSTLSPVPTWLSSSLTGGTLVSSIVLTQGTGTVYLRGALPANPGAYTLTMTITDTTATTVGTITSRWTVTS